MIKRAVKHGFKAKYVWVDSWFSSKGFIESIRQIKDKAIHVLCGVRKGQKAVYIQWQQDECEEAFVHVEKGTERKAMPQAQYTLL